MYGGNQKSEIRNQKSAAFTLVELLVVITIIGILIALLLPALQAAREAARRVQCMNNFKQVGIALHSYHAAIGCFPPGTIDWFGACGRPPGGPAEYYGWGWGTFILPYMEQQALYDKFDFNGDLALYTTPGNPGNLVAAAMRIDTYLCPSDPQNGELTAYTGSTYPGHSSNPDEDIRMSNMAGVCDSRSTYCGTWDIKPFSQADGIMANLGGCTLAQVKDGSSNTLIIGENTGGGPGSHYGRWWVNYNVFSTVSGINSTNSVPGGATTWVYWKESGFSSYHPGGCHFLLADGSVQFFSQNIDALLLAKLTTRDGGEPITGGY